ncbi:AMP-binding protein [Actinomadura sp. DC4]|uniref:AMP-binding protein n=1 Tax=Actinomadura sp. DC4 TaxID=3055069 RepID=UPI0025B0F694|nr:AMP-binding protein [Actinomadura sp. DC4]MDN3358813.1 AMP-binding protein [Actinomadura sp. DC4]
MSDAYRRRGWWRDETFLDDLRRGARDHPDKAAVAVHRGAGDSTRVLGYAELSRLTDRCASALVELGLRPGDFFAVQLTDRWELAVLALGCMRAGVRFCPLMPIYRRWQLEAMLRVSGARVFVTMAEHAGDRPAEIGLELAAGLPDLERVLVADGPALDGTRPFESFFFDTPWEESHGGELDARELGPDDPYLLLFTSGTTSESKGVLHSQNTLHAAIRGEAGVFGLDGSLVMTTSASYSHYTGVAQGMLMPLMLGGTMVFQDSRDPAVVLDVMARHGVTFLYIAPPALQELMDEQRRAPRDLSALRWLVCGSSPVPPYFVDDVREVFKTRLFSLWGMTENGPVTISRPEDPDDWAAHSDGSPIADMELRIDPVSERSDGVGVLWVRGPTQCLGYYRREGLYAAKLDAGGWFNTDDLVRPDGRGGIRVTGRATDMILRHANIVPVADLETIIGRHPGVREMAVVGLPEQDLDETVCVVVVPVSPESPVTLEDLHRALAGAGMAELYWPQRLEIVETLPKTPTGKTRKVELKERFAPPG